MKGKIMGAVAGAVIGFVFKKVLDKMDKQEQIIREYEELDQGNIKTERSWHDPDYSPRCVWICDHCNSLLQFHDTREAMQEHIDQVKDCDGLICPQCNGFNEIDEWTRTIMNDRGIHL